MSYNNQHPSDEIIERELKGLREPEASSYGLGDAIRSMQATPAPKRSRLKWPVGIGTVAVAAFGIILVSTLTAGKAYAGELRAIASAQLQQKTMYQKAYHFGGAKQPQRVMEFWIDRNREAYRQFTGEGELEFARVADGDRMHTYNAGSPEIARSATIEEDRGPHFGIETIDSLLHSDFFKKHKIEKTSGVKLNGRTCDYYSFANGYYRVWVDPATKLPLQREIYNKGVTLWERDVYQYPAAFAEATFEPIEVQGLEYFDYVTARKQLETKLAQPGITQRVGNVTITLKAVIKDNQLIRAIWSTSGVKGGTNLEITGARAGFDYQSNASTLSIAPGQNLVNEGLTLNPGFTLPATVRIAAFEPGQKLVGWATFTVNEVQTTPSNGQLL
ncbi:MAG: hypothetical protein ABL962_11095, partial [Fimbriimonadaceae bacterium]